MVELYADPHAIYWNHSTESKGRLKKSAPWLLSLIAHLVILFAGGFWYEKAQFAIDAGHQGMEVNLVAAARESGAPEVPAESSPLTLPESQADDLITETKLNEAKLEQPRLDTPTRITQPKITHMPQPTTALSQQKERGDGSSPIPGKDATTAHSDAGAYMNAKPVYLRNPAPAYPEECRTRREEGLVILSVIIDPSGVPEDVLVHASSGYSLLDKAAREAVQKWRFRPATSLGVKIRAKAKVPVRFRLES